MAKILLGAAIGDARGSVGAHTFTKGRFGPVLRQKVSPVQPRSAKVMAIRAFFQRISGYWSSAAMDAYRAGWDSLAAITNFTNAFGNTYHPTGLQLFQMCNRNLQLLGLPILDPAPANLTIDPPLTADLTAAATGPVVSLAFTPDPVPADVDFCFEATPCFKNGVNFAGPRYKWLANRGPDSASPADLAAAYSAIFGTPRAGTKLFVRVWAVSRITGAASQELVATATVGA
jgi:hypothetical protein